MRNVDINSHKGKLIKSFFVAFMSVFILGGFVSNVNAGDQVVSFSSDQLVVLRGESGELSMAYDVIGGSKQTTGIGLRIHYNSGAIAALSLKDAYWEGLIARDEVAQNDVQDFDNDPLTDKYIGVAWVGVQGDWPKSGNLPAELGKILLKVRSDSETSQTRLNLTSSGNPAGYRFYGGSTVVVIP